MALRLGYTADPFSKITGDVVLSEIGARREENDRLLFTELVSEYARQPGICTFSYSCSVNHCRVLFRVVVNEEVLGLEDAPLEMFVLDLVLSEILLGL